MSKSKGNVVNPWDAIADHGSDALRWYFIVSSNPWVPKRYDPEGVGEAARKFFDTLFNTYRFFTMYADVEAWAPSGEDPDPDQRPLLDRWLVSRLESVVGEVQAEIEAYQLTRAYRILGDFVVEDLSNWYVRRSRARFWGNDDAADMRAAFRTLWDALRTVSLLAAPVVPFTADWLHRALTGKTAHLERFPRAGARDEGLEADMEAARMLVSLGRAAREEVRIRVRQPLKLVEAVVPGGRALSGEVLEVVRDELNVKEVRFLSSSADLVALSAKPNYRALGGRFGKQTNDAANAIRGLDEDRIRAFQRGETVEIDVGGERHALQADELDVLQEATGDLVVKGEGAYTVALDPELDDALRAEGLARELVNRIQRLRKDAGLEITDRIELGISGPDTVRAAANLHRDFIGGETLALEVAVLDDGAGEADGFPHATDVDLDGTPAWIALRPAAR